MLAVAVAAATLNMFVGSAGSPAPPQRAHGPAVTLVAATRLQYASLPPAAQASCDSTERAELATVDRHATATVRREARRILRLIQGSTRPGLTGTEGDLTFPRRPRPFPGQRPIDLGHALRYTAPVADNVLSLRIVDRGTASYPAVIVERSADGAPIRTLLNLH